MSSHVKLPQRCLTVLGLHKVKRFVILFKCRLPWSLDRIMKRVLIAISCCEEKAKTIDVLQRKKGRVHKAPSHHNVLVNVL